MGESTKDQLNKLIAANFRFIRTQILKLNQTEMAAHFAITPQGVSRIESGDVLTSIFHFYILSDLSGIKIDDMVRKNLSEQN